jgi:hypothetical protein
MINVRCLPRLNSKSPKDIMVTFKEDGLDVLYPISEPFFAGATPAYHLRSRRGPCPRRPLGRLRALTHADAGRERVTKKSWSLR